MARCTACTSSSSVVSGMGAAMTWVPACCSFWMTRPQLDPSAQAPWTRTTAVMRAGFSDWDAQPKNMSGVGAGQHRRPWGCLGVAGGLVPASERQSRSLGGEEDARVEDAGRIEALFDPVHELDLGRVFEFEVVRALGAAEAVFAGDRATQFHCQREDVGQQLLLLVRVLAEDRQVHV